MPVVLVAETVQVPQEAKALKDALVALVAALVAKKSIPELVAIELPLVEAAIGNISQLPDEAKAPQIAVLAGLLGGQVGQVLLGG